MLPRIKKIIWQCHNFLESYFARCLPILADSRRSFIIQTLKDFKAKQAAFGGLKHLIDVGGGNGKWSFLGEILNCHYTVMDLQIPQNPSSNFQTSFCVGNAENLPLTNASADAVMSIEVLEHCRHPEKIIGEISRILKPGGPLILSTRQYWRTHGGGPDYFRFTQQGLESIMQDAGFTVSRALPLGGPTSIIATVIEQNNLWLSKPILKQIFVYPIWLLAILIDKLFYLRSKTFCQVPDTSGWLVVATKN